MDDNQELSIPQGTPSDPVVKGDGVKYMATYLGGKDGEEGTVIQLSQREEQLTSRFLKTLSIQEAAKEINVSVKTARRYLKRPNVQRLIKHLIEKAAIRQGTDLDETISWLRKARDGIFKPNDIQVKCGKELAKILRPAGAGLTINNNTQVNANFESPYKDLSADTMRDKMRESLDAIEGGNPGTA